MSGSEPLDRASLAAALAEEEARLQRLDAERADAKARADALRVRLAAAGDARGVQSAAEPACARAPQSSSEKVKLFRQLFRGREDVYPTRFVSKKTGKPVYAPACSNKWEPGLCALKTGGKCDDCHTMLGWRISTESVRNHQNRFPLLGGHSAVECEACHAGAATGRSRSATFIPNSMLA